MSAGGWFTCAIKNIDTNFSQKILYPDYEIPSEKSIWNNFNQKGLYPDSDFPSENSRFSLQIIQIMSCWGSNMFGQAEPGESMRKHAYKVAAGELHACALNLQGMMACWGMNSSDELKVPLKITMNGLTKHRTPIV